MGKDPTKERNVKLMTNNETIPPVVITGIGMMTSVGHNAYQSCASIRADIVRIVDIDYFLIENDWFEEVPITGCPIIGITDGYLGLGRWTKMASAAIQDLIMNANLSERDLTQTGLFLALPPLERKGVDQRITDMLGLRIGQWNKIEGLEQRTRVYPDGHAATAKATKATSDAIQELQANNIKYAIVGGVDSLVEPATLEFFHDKKRLKTEDNTDGFIPGEGAAFVMLEVKEQAMTREAEIMAILEAPHTAMESITIWSEDPSEGLGLSEAIRGTLGQLSDKGMNTGLIICDLNGETYRAKEFANTVPRVLNEVKTAWQLWHPAESIGNTGAASFAISTCLGARALQRGYAGTENILIWGSSDDGLRGSLYLRHYAD